VGTQEGDLVVASTDGVTQATEVINAATKRGVPLRLLGGLAVQVLTPDFPPRVRDDQDLDFVSVDTAKKPLMELFSGLGYQGDSRFNTLHGDHQMYFRTPDGSRAVDVIMNQLSMCHTLEFKGRLDRMPYTLDVTDLLLTKLQVVEQNEKDAQDIIYLLSAFEAVPGDEPGTIGLDRITAVIGSDWGWWRTVTRNLDRVAELSGGPLRGLVPASARRDPAAQARALRAYADACPKTMRWKMRARVGERVRWYELPEEVGH
jgi:hypothetical protein